MPLKRGRGEDCCETLSIVVCSGRQERSLQFPRPWCKCHARLHFGAFDRVDRENKVYREMGIREPRNRRLRIEGESFVVPPVIPLSLLQGSFMLGCWRGRYFVQYPTSATLATRMCVARTHAKSSFLRFGSSLCLPVDGPGFLSVRPGKLFLGKKTLGGTSNNFFFFLRNQVFQPRLFCYGRSEASEKTRARPCSRCLKSVVL